MKNTKVLQAVFCLAIGYCITTCGESSSKEETLPVQFSKEVVYQETFISEGVAVGEVNRYVKMEIMAGAYWFEGPDWRRHEIYAPGEFDYAKEWSDSFLNFATDVDKDGWVDFIRFDFPGKGAYWYRNPKGKDDHWQMQLIDPTACNESPMLVDVDGNGTQDLVFGRERTGEMMWFRVEEEADSIVWRGLAISEEKSPGTRRFSHGLGFEDVNGDGRKDVVIRGGWWEAPVDRMQVPWTFHPAPLGLPCSQMHGYDFDADGDRDIISCSAHAYGIWWYEQVDQNGEVSFIRHLIDSTFSQTHAAALADLNGDGLPDLLTGKRYFAHLGKDPGG